MISGSTAIYYDKLHFRNERGLCDSVYVATNNSSVF